MIDSPEALDRLARSLSAAPTLGLDTEGDGLYRYRSRLCTMQIAHPGGIAIVDTLAIPDRSPLGPILGADGPEKVLHDCAFDARLLAGNGLSLGNVFDTAIAARFLGEVSTGLASLLAKELGVTIGKELQQADWGERPLDPERVAYLEMDVRHLLELAQVLRDRCREADILEEVRLESEWAAGGTDDEQPTPAWTRVKGAGEVRSSVQLAVLRELAELRETIARDEDVPPFRVLPNPVLLVLARKQPRDLSALEGFGAIARRRELARAVIAAVRRGLDAGQVPQDELAILRPPAPPFEERELRKKREAALSAWRKSAAEARGVGIQVVLPGHVLRELAGKGARSEDDLRAIAGFGEVRVERYGRALLDLLASVEP